MVEKNPGIRRTIRRLWQREATPAKEPKKDSPQEIINAFNAVYQRLDFRTAQARECWESHRSRELLAKRFKQDQPQIITFLSDFCIISRAVWHLGGDGKGLFYDTDDYTFPVEVPGQFFIREGVPIEGLLRLIDAERSAPPSVTGEQEYHRFMQARNEEERTIRGNSIRFIDAHNHGDAFSNQRRALEAFIISQDPLRRNDSPNSQYARDNNWIQAGRVLAKRRELVVPPL
ncbi:MAG: hypothetical protein HYU80_01470 [Candidatus Blackburnbacteria bacterium]|nr:hypothetical protein [Candidatus Blackburnbacteria bacterium]